MTEVTERRAKLERDYRRKLFTVMIPGTGVFGLVEIAASLYKVQMRKPMPDEYHKRCAEQIIQGNGSIEYQECYKFFEFNGTAMIYGIISFILLMSIGYWIYRARCARFKHRDYPEKIPKSDWVIFIAWAFLSGGIYSTIFNIIY